MSSVAEKAVVLGRGARSVVQSSRWGRAIYAGVSATLKSFAHTAYLIFLEITGAFFLMFAAVGAWKTWRAYQAWAAGTGSQKHVAIGIGFTLVFLYFGVSSFWKARKKSN